MKLYQIKMMKQMKIYPKRNLLIRKNQKLIQELKKALSFRNGKKM